MHAAGLSARWGLVQAVVLSPVHGPDTRGCICRAYDARLNPFAEFQKNELDARMLRMGSWDRAILSLCR